jgi:hypothetical protein
MKRTTQQINADIHHIQELKKHTLDKLNKENHPVRKRTLIIKAAILKNRILALEKERKLLSQTDLFE